MATTAPLGKMVIELGLDSTDFGKSLQSSKREVRYWSNDMRASMRAADMAGNTLGKFEARHNGLTKVIEGQRKTVDRLKQSYDNSFVDGKSTAQTEKLAAELRNAESQMINYNKQLVNNAGEMAKWRVENEGVTGSLNRFGETLTKRGDQMAKFGDSMTKRVTLPIVAGVGLVVKAAMDWESAWAGVQKTNDEVVDANGNIVYSYEQLEDELRGLTKQLPATHAEIAATAEAAGQLGIETESVVDFTKTMIDLGEATNMSAETAATSLARFANITNMSQENFDRLGSSIVEVGNNFATTESEISELALRLAAAGSQVGMSEADIVGLAGALSSVGVEAQAGGTAFSKVMIEMQLASEKGSDSFAELNKHAEDSGVSWDRVTTAVNKGGKELTATAEQMGLTNSELKAMYKEASDAEQSLTNFAEVAGLTNEEFEKMFQTDPSQAIQSFIEGLARAEEQGTSAIKVLDDMGISEVRLRDSLLRASNASELFAGAIQMSNDAWEENTALSEEANIRYETLESQLGMLRNEAYDTAIEFGGPFVGALRDGLDAARPLIEQIANLAKAFSDADPETQQMIIRVIALTAASGPLLSVTGRLTRGIGGMTTNTVRFLGEMSKTRTVKRMTTELMTVTTQTGSFAGAAATAAGGKGVGAMTGALGAFSSVAWPIVGVGGLLAVGYGAWKLWGEEAYESAQRTKEWGVDVGEEAHNALTSFQEMSEEVSLATWKMSTDVEEGASQAMESYSSMTSEIAKSAQENIAAQEEELAGLPDTVRGIMQSLHEDRLTEQNRIVTEVESINASINAIYSQAMEENRELTNQELEMVENHHARLNELRAETLDMSVEDQRQVQSVLLEDLKTFSEDELWTRVGFLDEQTKAVGDMYDEQIELLRQAVIEGELSQSEADRKEAELLEERKRTNMDFAKEYVKIWNEMEVPIEQQNETLAQYGITHSDVMQEIAFGSVEAGSSISYLAETTGELTEEAREANNMWNDFTLENKFGEVDTNVHEVIQEASESEKGWEELQFILKHADLNTNSRETIREALEENGKWNELDWYHHEANVFTNAQGTAKEYLKANGDWEKLTFQERIAFLDTNTPEQLQQILEDFGIWNGLDPAIQELITTSNADSMSREGVAAIDDWNEQRPLPLHLNTTTNAPDVVQRAQRAINSLRGKTVRVQTVHSVSGMPHSSGPYATGLAKGTNYHKGGLAVVNDQIGSKFREMVSYPNGQSFVPHGRNVLLDLPKGSKVFRAALTEKLLPGIPQYANGVGIPSDASVIQNINRVSNATQSNSSQDANYIYPIMSQLLEIINAIRDGSSDINDLKETLLGLKIVLDTGRTIGELAPGMSREIEKNNNMVKRSNGVIGNGFY